MEEQYPDMRQARPSNKLDLSESSLKLCWGNLNGKLKTYSKAMRTEI